MNTNTTTQFTVNSISIDGVTVEAEVNISLDIEEISTYHGPLGDEYTTEQLIVTPRLEGSFVDSDIWLFNGSEMVIEDGEMFRAAEHAILQWVVNTEEGRQAAQDSFDCDCEAAAEHAYERSLEARW